MGRRLRGGVLLVGLVLLLTGCAGSDGPSRPVGAATPAPTWVHMVDDGDPAVITPINGVVSVRDLADWMVVRCADEPVGVALDECLTVGTVRLNDEVLHAYRVVDGEGATMPVPVVHAQVEVMVLAARVG